MNCQSRLNVSDEFVISQILIRFNYFTAFRIYSDNPNSLIKSF